MATASRVSNYMVESGNNFTWDYGSYILSGDGYAWMSLPFNFTYDGITYPAGSTLIVSNDGWISFDPNSYYRYDNGNVGNPNYPNTIYAVGLGLYNYYGTYWNVTGSSGKRVLTVMWDYTFDENWWYGNYFSLKLYEENNAIGFQYYGLGWWYSGYYQLKVGLNGNNGPNGFSSNLQHEAYWTPYSNFKMRPPKPDVPAMTVSTSHIQFGNLDLGMPQTLCLTVTNTGSKGEPGGAATPLVIGTPSISGSPAEFSVVSGPSANNLDIGQSAQICVQFVPNWPYTRTSTLTIPTINANTEKVTLAGRGVAPEMAFEAAYLFRKTKTKLEQSTEESFWIKSTGLGPLTITDLVLGGDYPNQYEIVERPMAPIPPGDSGLVTVRLTPHYEGLKTARLTVKSNGFLNKEQVVHLFGLGILPRLVVTPGVVAKDSIAMGDSMMYTIRLENIGSDTVNILQHFMAFADRDFTFYGLSGTDTAIPPERFRDLYVTFKPTTRGHRQARIRVLTDIPLTYEQNPRDTSIFEVDVFGTGVPYGLMSVESGAMLDSAIVGEQVCQTVKIWNNGQLSLTVNSIDVLGSDASDFTFSGVTFPLTIQPQSSVDVQVCATPSERGIRAASLAVNGSSSDKTTTVELPLEVYGLLACASPDVNAAFNEEIVRVGTSSTASVVITNCGDVPSSFTAAINGAAYALSGAATSPVIAPGATHTFDVTYNASEKMPQP
ncbi:MAG TPA: choice-of-anchor D domain-containing protein, partial [Candidatus Kapabacteria bacterium]|nr:choice-of-anchor D domain-containing protein [Candidatus Kapabacteria bacterium]